MLTEYYFAVRYGDIIILLYHEDMMSVWELLFKNSQKEKALKRFLEYCYMIDVKVAFEGLKGEKTKGLKATLKFAKEHDMCMIPGWKLRQLLNKRLSDYRRTYVAAKLWRLI